MIAVTDTHALLWSMTGQMQKLGRRARSFFEKAEQRKHTIYVPAISLLEVGELVARGRVTLPREFPAWVRALTKSGGFVVHNLDADVVIESFDLRDIPERSDRIIAASAMVLGCPLITRDAEIAAVARVDRLWD